MGEAKNTIEINGKRYDAKTGALLNSPRKTKKAAGVIIDGVVKHHAPSPVHHSDKPRSKPNPSPAAHKGKTKKSATLMRKGLKKPAAKIVHEDHPSILGTDMTDRLRRAQSVAKSRKISRFPKLDMGVVKKAQPLAVHHPASPKPAAHKPTHKKGQEPVVQHFEQAISDATSHLTQYSEKKRKRLFKSKKINAVAGTLSVLLLVGFFGFQNTSNIQMRMAAADAGFSAHMPGYKPAGFGVAGPIKSEPGKVTVSFHSRTDDKSFNVTQTASNWSSESLNNHLASKANKQTWQEKGKTIYLYDNSSASWVDSGVWYQVEGNASLTTDQLVRIVNSL